MNKWLVALAFAVFATAHPAAAQVIYKNPGAGASYALTSTLGIAADRAATVTDDFLLSPDAGPSYAVNGLSWSGYYYDANTDKFRVGVAPASQTFLVGIVDATTGARPVYDQFITKASGYTTLNYKVSFPDITLLSDRRYILSVVALGSAYGTEWSWAARGDTGNAIQRYDFRNEDTGMDMTFSLYGAANAVPEPATWALMLVGVGAVGSAMRRRQRIATGMSRAA